MFDFKCWKRYFFHYFFFAISGVVHKKKYPESKEKCKYLVVSACKDEEKVIGRLIKSVKDANYPQDKLDFVVIAHNCSDKTAEIAKELGARVIVYNDENAKDVGHAYKYAFSHIDNLSSYDGVIFFDADNVVDKEFFSKINDAFIYYDKKDTVISFRHSLNFDSGVLPAVYGLYFGTSCLLAFSGRNNFNVSGRITGCGFVMPSKDLLDGWNYLSITQDVEYSADQIVKGKTIHYCDEAIFYDEQPRKVKVMWKQRLRWAKGQIVISKKYFFKNLKALFSKDSKNKMSLFISLSFHSFPCIMTLALGIAYFACISLSPLFGVSYFDTFLYWNHNVSFFHNMFLSMRTGALYLIIRSLVMLLVSGYLAALAVYIAGYKKYRYNNKWKLFLASLIYPFFLGLQFALDVVALFKRNVTWAKIPHGD